MISAYAGLLYGGRCREYKHPRVGWDDCATWSKISNVVIEGSGTIDGAGRVWRERLAAYQGLLLRLRPVLLDLLWADDRHSNLPPKPRAPCAVTDRSIVAGCRYRWTASGTLAKWQNV